MYNRSIEDSSLTDELKKAAKGEKETAKAVMENPEGAAEKAKATA